MKKLVVALACVAGVIGLSTLAYAAGMWPDLPVVGGATYCAGSSQSATGSIIGSVTGCPNQVPAGPTIVTGNEQIPADTRLSSGAAPQTVLIPMASLNALPIQFVTVTSTNPAISAANTSGGLFVHSTAVVTTTAVTLPQAPIDGQQYAIAADAKLSLLTVSAGALTLGNSGLVTAISPTVGLGTVGIRYIYNAALSTWFRLY